MKVNVRFRSLVAGLCAMMIQPLLPAQTVTDFDGNVYDTVKIGSLIWLKQNLKTTHYRNGVSIPQVADSAGWFSLASGARCYYGNDSAANNSIYGALYNFYAVNNVNGLCPEGWHVSSDAEWTQTENYLGGAMSAGGAMKDTGTLLWSPPNAGATNSSGFTGLPGGARYFTVNFGFVHENGLFWTSSVYAQYAWGRYVYYLNAAVERDPVFRNSGISVRCIKDVNVGLKDPGKSEFRIYPNPSSGLFTVEVPGFTGGGRLAVSSADGREILEQTINQSETIFDLSLVPAGIYIVKLTIGDKTEIWKVVKW